MIRIINRGRQCGKTVEMIRMAAEQNLRIVCVNKEQAKRIERMAFDMEMDILPPMVWEAFTSGGTRGYDHRYLIDNLDDCLRRYGGVAGFSVTGASVE
ncbi:hypothetical protein ACFYU5_19305 [Nocardia aobensis]|uniref:Replicase n=1 Tax=Nocardia aobensis TaxID=257277 RepID=A0ABW6P5Y7_9NOCA